MGVCMVEESGTIKGIGSFLCGGACRIREYESFRI